MRNLYLSVLAPVMLSAEVLNDQSLNGSYYFVHLTATVSITGHLLDVRSTGGTLTFNGQGAYTVTRRLPPDASSGTSAGDGKYGVSSDGRVKLSSPNEPELSINGRLGAGSTVLLGSATEIAGRRDMFVAIAAGTRNGPATLQGKYALGMLRFPSNALEAFSTSLAELTADGKGGISGIIREHERRNVEEGLKGLTRTREVSGAYTVSDDGAGELTLGEPANTSQLFASADGDVLISVSRQTEYREIAIGIRTMSNPIIGNYWLTEMLLDTEIAGGTRLTSSTGATRSDGAGRLYLSQRLNAGERWRNVTAVNLYTLNAEGWGQMGPVPAENQTNFAAGRQAFIAAQVGNAETITHLHGILFGFRMPEPTGTGVFLSPHGVSNTTAKLPPTAPLSPAQEVVLNGSGFADQNATAGDTWPVQLNGIRVTVNGTAAPLGAVGPSSILVRIPDEVTGSTAEFVVHKGTSQSNAVVADLIAATPMIVSRDGSGSGSASMDDASANEEATFLATGIRKGAPVTAFLAGRPVRVVSVSEGPTPGVVKVAIQTPPSLPSGRSAALALASGDAFTCLVDAPLKGP